MQSKTHRCEGQCFSHKYNQTQTHVHTHDTQAKPTAMPSSQDDDDVKPSKPVYRAQKHACWMDDSPLKDIKGNHQWGKTLNGSLLSRWPSLFVAVSVSDSQQQQPLNSRGVVPSRGSRSRRTRVGIAAHQGGHQLLPLDGQTKVLPKYPKTMASPSHNLLLRIVDDADLVMLLSASIVLPFCILRWGK